MSGRVYVLVVSVLEWLAPEVGETLSSAASWPSRPTEAAGLDPFRPGPARAEAGPAPRRELHPGS
jgi:hypothetical protein